MPYRGRGPIAMATLSPGATHHRRPDIVLIVVDDLMRTTLPSYGASAKFGELTPYMNQIVMGGNVFENAYTTSAICTPSRLSLMTGRYVSDLMPTELFETVPRVHFDGPDLANLTTLPRMLNGAGYRTGLFGKYHLAPRRFLVDSMVRACNVTGAMVPTLEDLDQPEFLRTWNPFRKHGCISALVKQQTGFTTAKEVYFDTVSIEEVGHNPEAMADAAATFVRSARADDKPFFVYFAPTLTHSPLCYGGALLEEPGAVDYVPPEATMLKWKQQRLNVLKRLTKAGVLCPDADTRKRRARWVSEIASSLLADPTPITASATDPARHQNDSLLKGKMPNGTAAISARENCPRGRGGSLHMTCPTHNSSEHYVQMLLDDSAPRDFTVDGIGAVSYVEMVVGLAWLDESLGPLMDALEPSDDTLVILTSDHGNGLTGKGAVYEGGVRVPLITRWPRHADRQGGNDLLISHVDLLPTLGMLVGASPTDGARGRDLLAQIYPYCSAARENTAHFSFPEQRLHYQNNRELFFEVGYSRAVVRGGWKLIRMVGPRNVTEDDTGRCHSVQGELLDPTLGVFDAAGKRMIWRSYELHQKTYCDPVQLYFLKDDPLEQVNVASKRPRLVQQMSQLLRQEFAIANVGWTPPWEADAAIADELRPIRSLDDIRAEDNDGEWTHLGAEKPAPRASLP